MIIRQLLFTTLKRTKLPVLDTELILAYVLKKTREYVFTHPEFKLSKIQLQKFKKLVLRRKKGEPIAYLTGKKGFYDLEFLVNKNVLIPRPETELIVDEVKSLTRNKDYQFSIIDVGTGSGCIIITLAKLLKQNAFYGIDISSQALQVAKKNAKSNDVINIKFIHGDLLNPFLNNPKNPKILNNPTIIIANLPYLTKEQIKNSSSIKKEPRLALLGGKNGLYYYEKLLQQINLMHLKSSCIFLEIDPSQKTKIKSLIKKYLPTADIEIKKDLKGHNRLVKISLSP
jgi:release factor glutamine methyltransferase